MLGHKTRIVVLAISVFILCGATRDKDKTSLNGIFWNSLGEYQRSAWAEGFLEGFTLRMTKDGKFDRDYYRADEHSPSVGEIKDSMNVFYKESKNLPVCMYDAADIGWRNMAGHPVTDSVVEIDRAMDGQIGCD